VPDADISGVVQSVLALRLDLDATAIADALWLAAGEPDVEPAPASVGPITRRQRDFPGTPNGAPGPPAHGARRSGDDPDVPFRPPIPDRAVRAQPPTREGIKRASDPMPLNLGRSLRPFKRRWRNGRQLELDIDATVRAYARSWLLTPEFRPAPERWFDADIVIDDSPSMRVWAEMLSVLPDLFHQLGAFRSVRVWRMSATNDISNLTSDGGRAATSGQLRSPDGRRLIVVVTDGAAAGWLTGDAWKPLRSWAASTPTALITPLATRLWDRTGLALPAIRVGPGAPGSPNAQLQYSVPYSLALGEGRHQDWLPLPIATLNPHMLGRWARTLMKGDPHGCHALLIPSDSRLVSALPLSPDDTPDGDGAHSADAFRKTASAPAARIAVLCAPFSRVTLSLLRLLAQELVPGASTADLAEVMAGGLFRPPSGDHGDITLEFRPGVRERLQEMLTESDGWRVYDTLHRQVTNSATPSETFPIESDGPRSDNEQPDGPLASALHETLLFLDAVPETTDRQTQRPPAQRSNELAPIENAEPPTIEGIIVRDAPDAENDQRTARVGLQVNSLADYPRPSVAVDVALLTVIPGEDYLSVLQVRRAEVSDTDPAGWGLPWTFLHEGEMLIEAVQRCLRDAAAPTARVRQTRP
jgi:hypothetical protein